MKKFIWLFVAVGMSASAWAGIRDLIGEWVMERAGGEIGRLIIKDNGEFFDSKHGRGDIEHRNARRYTITVYMSGSGQFVRCEVLIDFTADGQAHITQLSNPNVGRECDWGKLRRASEGVKPALPPQPAESGGTR